jgi:hypothetical protein
MREEDRERVVPKEAFALLGHDIRLDILSAFFERYSPVDPASRSEVRDRRTLSYSELMAATGTEDSGKFNYHLEKLRGAYVQKVDAGYVPTASAVALYQAAVANRPTESLPVDFDVDGACPTCGTALRGRYEQEYLTVDCPACDLFWGLTYHFPKNGLIVRDGEDVYEALYDRLMYHVGLARTGQCPSCAGVTDVTIPRNRLDGAALPTAEMTCGTCSWIATVDVLSALQYVPRVTRALLELDLPIGTSSSMRATEGILPDVTGRVRSDDPFRAVVSVDRDDTAIEIVVDGSLGVRSVTVE